MKIIEAISDTNIGGAGILLLERLCSRPEYKEKTVVLLPKYSRLAERLKEKGITVAELPLKPNTSFNIVDTLKIISFLKDNPADIINTHGFLSARIAAYFCKVPIKICTRHCAFDIAKRYKYAPIKKLLGAINSSLSDIFIAVAVAARENLLDMGIKKDKIRVIVNGGKRPAKFIWVSNPPNF